MIILPNIEVKKKNIKEVDKKILQVIYDILFKDITQTINDFQEIEKNIKINSKSLLLQAIKSGRLTLKDGIIRGRINARLSIELKRLGAIYDKRKKNFKTTQPLPQDIRMLFLDTEIKLDDLGKNIKRSLDQQALDVSDNTAFMQKLGSDFDEDLILDDLAKGIDNSLKKAPIIQAEFSKAFSKDLQRNYVRNIQLGIKNFTQESIEALRNNIIESFADGVRPEAIAKTLQKELKSSKKKALRIAKQEIGILSSQYKQNRYKSLGIDEYKWVTSHDSRVRDDHKDLNNKIFSWDNPPVVDKTTGRKAHPQEDFGCRCTARPVII